MLAAEQARQQAAHQSLATIAAEEYEDALTTIDGALSDGSLLRGEVLSRWHDFVGTGDFFRSLDSTIGRLRDRVGCRTARPACSRPEVEDALESGIHAVVLDAPHAPPKIPAPAGVPAAPDAPCWRALMRRRLFLLRRRLPPPRPKRMQAQTTRRRVTKQG